MADAGGHRRHDRLAIASSIDAGMTMPPWLAACLFCAGLRADLMTIRSHLPSVATPPRTRDYRLTAADAGRLRHSGWRRSIGLIGTAADGVTRPLVVAFATLGLAGLLVGAIPVGVSLGSFGASGAASSSDAAYPAPATVVPDGAERGPAGFGARLMGRPTPTTAEPNPGTLLSGGLLAMAVALFGIRRLASRAGRVR